MNKSSNDYLQRLTYNGEKIDDSRYLKSAQAFFQQSMRKRISRITPWIVGVILVTVILETGLIAFLIYSFLQDLSDQTVLFLPLGIGVIEFFVVLAAYTFVAREYLLAPLYKKSQMAFFSIGVIVGLITHAITSYLLYAYVSKIPFHSLPEVYINGYAKFIIVPHLIYAIFLGGIVMALIYRLNHKYNQVTSEIADLMTRESIRNKVYQDAVEKMQSIPVEEVFGYVDISCPYCKSQRTYQVTYEPFVQTLACDTCHTPFDIVVGIIRRSTHRSVYGDLIYTVRLYNLGKNKEKEISFKGDADIKLYEKDQISITIGNYNRLTNYNTGKTHNISRLLI